MNFETISRFDFKPIEKEIRSQQETIHIGKNRVTMTKALLDRMGNPEFVQFAYDAKEMAIGVRITDSDHGSCQIKSWTGRGAYVLNSSYVSEKISSLMNVDLQTKTITLKRGYKLDDWYVFELRHAEVLKKESRKRHD